MPRNHEGLPRATRTTISKHALLGQLITVDETRENRERVLALETSFRRKVDAHVASLPASDAILEKFNTSPFVLLIHARQREYTKVSDLERDILPAKQFSSMETSAGRMVEEVVLPAYGWECVGSEMHTANSALDGKKRDGDKLFVATLKSGPRCLNDEMSENFADAILNNYQAWARDAGVSDVDFTYGVLYGTKKLSNKKDWHILRNLKEKRTSAITIDPADRWNCALSSNGIQVSVTVRIGLDWWNHLGGELCFVEVMAALIRACITPGVADGRNFAYAISDMNSIVSTSVVRESYNVSLLQQSQLPWLFLVARHFCDILDD
jgi:hypothetical protein